MMRFVVAALLVCAVAATYDYGLYGYDGYGYVAPARAARVAVAGRPEDYIASCGGAAYNTNTQDCCGGVVYHRLTQDCCDGALVVNKPTQCPALPAPAPILVHPAPVYPDLYYGYGKKY